MLLAIADGIGVYVGRMVDRQSDAAIIAADRDDPNWRLDDLLAHRERVPDDKNSAMVVAEFSCSYRRLGRRAVRQPSARRARGVSTQRRRSPEWVQPRII